MSDVEVLAMKKKAFFFWLRQAERLAAERDARMLTVLAAVNSDQNSYKSVVKSLQDEIGVVYEFSPFIPSKVIIKEGESDPEFDRAAFAALKAKYGRRQD